MATYSAPSGAVMRGYNRLQGAAFGVSDTTLETSLTTNVTDGEDTVFSRVGVGYETDATLTARQVRHLQRAVAFRTGITFLTELLIDVNGGTYEPLLVANPEDIERLITMFEERAQEQENLLTGSGEATDSTRYARPSISGSTFVVTSSDRLPSERADLQDERDDISSVDVDNG